MIDDLLHHEIEVVKAFYARSMSWVATESASEAAKLAGASEEVIEFTVLHHNGPHSFEQIVVRSVINELNALCEFALQQTWQIVSKGADLPSGEHAIGASRGVIEKALAARGVDVATWPRWPEVEKIKELSEAYKHRQRMQPLPEIFQNPRFAWRANRLVDPENVEWIASYDLCRTQASGSIAAVEELLRWLREKYAA